MFSAKKVSGERLYVSARAGLSVERKPENIEIYSIALLSDDAALLTVNEDGTRDFRMRLNCSSGTYVRTIAHDIGERLKVGAHLVRLRRTRIGHFSISNSMTLDEMESMGSDKLKAGLISPSDMLSHLPFFSLDEEESRRVINGRAIALSGERSPNIKQGANTIRLCDNRGNLIAVGYIDAATGFIKPSVVLTCHDA